MIKKRDNDASDRAVMKKQRLGIWDGVRSLETGLADSLTM
jgi:hypothetical protein